MCRDHVFMCAVAAVYCTPMRARLPCDGADEAPATAGQSALMNTAAGTPPTVATSQSPVQKKLGAEMKTLIAPVLENDGVKNWKLIQQTR